MAPRLVQSLTQGFPAEEFNRGREKLPELREKILHYTVRRSQAHPEIWFTWKQFTDGKTAEQIAADLEGKFLAVAVTIQTNRGPLARTAIGLIAAYDPSQREPLLITELEEDFEIPVNPESDEIFIRVDAKESAF